MPEIRLGFLRAPSAVSALFAGIVHAAKLSDLFAVPTLELLRPEDLLYMHVKLSGVSRGADGWWSAGSTPGYITFHFPPQHVLEEAVLESEPSSKRRRSGRRPPDDEGVITLPLVTLLAEPSRVVVEVPPGYRFRRTTNGLLQALNDLEMKLSSSGAAEPIYRGPRSVAVARAGISSAIARAAAAVQPYSAATAAVLGRLGRMIEPPGEVGALTRLIAATVPGAFASASSAPTRIVAPRRPAGDQTSIEIPFRLLMAPLRGRWNHRVAHPQPSPAERYELWHTRLAIPRGKILDENPDAIERRAVALWTDERPGVAEDVITAQDGTELRSSLSAEDRAALVVEMRDRLPQRPHVHVRRWMLTSLGGWIDLRGEWPKGKVTGWEHRTTLGRDQFVRVTYPGWLWPLGHLATRIKITERKLLDPARDVAILWQREFLRIDEPHRLYSSPRGVRVETPFTSTEIGVRETPTLTLDPLKVAVLGDGTPYGFPITAVDRDHGIVTFDLPMIWVSLGPGTTAPGEGALQGAYGPPGSEGRTAELRGQRIGLVPSSKERPGDGAFEARSITLNGIVGEDERGIPRMKRAALFVEAVRALTGTSEPMEVAFHDRYIGGGANPAKMIFQLASGAPTPGADFSGATDKVGGFLSPSIAMTGLSQIQGRSAARPSKPAPSTAPTSSRASRAAPSCSARSRSPRSSSRVGSRTRRRSSPSRSTR